MEWTPVTWNKWINLKNVLVCEKTMPLIRHSRKRNCGYRKEISSCQGLVGKAGSTGKGMREVFRVAQMSVSQLWWQTSFKFVTTHQTSCSKWVNYAVCKCHLLPYFVETFRKLNAFSPAWESALNCFVNFLFILINVLFPWRSPYMWFKFGSFHLP